MHQVPFAQNALHACIADGHTCARRLGGAVLLCANWVLQDIALTRASGASCAAGSACAHR